MDTGGYKGWVPLKFYQGKGPGGEVNYTEGFKNVLNNHEVMPEKGHSGEPPYPTGDLSHCRHTSAAFRQGYDQIRWD